MKVQSIKIKEVLSDAEVFTDGDWVESKDQDPNGDVRLIQLADIGDGQYLNRSNRFLTSSKAKELRCTYLKKGDILIARMPDPLGRSCLFEGDLKPSVSVVDVCIVRPNPEKIDSKWFMHTLNCPFMRHKINRYSTGTTRKRISRKNLSKIEISLPPISEQKRIAAILDKADALREKRRQAIAKLDELLQSVFLDLFGDPVTNPMGWEVFKVGEIVNDFIGGKNIKCLDECEVSPLRMLKVSSVTWGVYQPTESKPAPLDFKPLDSYFVKKGDLLISRANTAELVAATVYVWDTPDNILLPDKIWRFSFSEKHKVDPLFIWELFKNKSFRREISKRSSGTSGSMKNISKAKLREIKMILPPYKLQKKFGDFSRRFHCLKESKLYQQQKFDDLFASLQQRAFKGEL